MASSYIAASITLLITLTIVGGGVFWRASRQEWRLVILSIIFHLPMCAVVFYFIRLPIDHLLQALIGMGYPSLYQFLKTLYAPLTEEPSKLLLLLIPWFEKNVHEKNVLRIGMSIGLGFGIGEMWLIAVWLSKNEEIISLPWYMLGGYMSERFMVCVMHGVFTSIALKTIRETPIRSLLAAMGLHYLGNFPIYLRTVNPGGWGSSLWGGILGVWSQVYFLLMVGVLIYFYRIKFQEIRLFLVGRAKCPECSFTYLRPLLGLNSFSKRYERCPGCKHFHWTKTLRDESG